MRIPSFLETPGLSLLLFGGKGGVGKTTCAVATGFRLAEHFPEKSFLLVSIDPAHSLADSLGGDSPPPNLAILEMDARQLLHSYKVKYYSSLHAIASKGTFLDDGDVNRLLDLSIPGFDEIVAFLEISERLRGGEYDMILVDTAPSGHTLRLLEMPEWIEQWLTALDSLLDKHRCMRQAFSRQPQEDDPDGFLADLANTTAATGRILCDPSLCRFIPVTLAEPLCVRETLDLIRKLKRLALPVKDIIVNELHPEGGCRTCAAERSRQTEIIGLLSRDESVGGSVIWGMPLYPEEVRRAPMLRTFWNRVRPVAQTTPASGVLSLPLVNRLVRPAPAPPIGAKLLIFGGKGGVGKTTLSCATALWLARHHPGKRVLLFSTDPAHSLSDCLEVAIGPKPTMIVPGLTAVEIDSRAEFEKVKSWYSSELKKFVSRISGNFDLPFDSHAMEEILHLAPPGLDEIMALTSVMEYVSLQRFDLFVLDSAATGHLFRLLELPALLHQWLRLFFDFILKYQKLLPMPEVWQRLVQFSKQLKKLRGLLSDSTAACLYAVGIPTEMALEETKDLVRAATDLGIRIPAIHLNLATPVSDCILCSALCRRESTVTRQFEESFPEAVIALVSRQAGLRGLKRLTDLSEVLYDPAERELVRYAR